MNDTELEEIRHWVELNDYSEATKLLKAYDEVKAIAEQRTATPTEYQLYLAERKATDPLKAEINQLKNTVASLKTQAEVIEERHLTACALLAKAAGCYGMLQELMGKMFFSHTATAMIECQQEIRKFLFGDPSNSQTSEDKHQ